MSRMVTLILSLGMLAGGGGGIPTGYEAVNQLPGVVLELQAESLSPSGAVCTVRNDGKIAVMFGSYYALERMEDGIWYQIPYLPQQHAVGWNDIGYEVAPGQQFTLDAANWDWLYGPLEPGTYRMVKEATVGRGPDLQRYYFAVEFVIEP